MNFFQHRHYKFIAAVIATIPDQEVRFQVAQKFDDNLHQTNPRYSSIRFMQAAMGKPSNGRDRTDDTTRTTPACMGE